MALVGSAATSTNPVPSVAVIAPSVPMLDSRPTTRPVSRRSASCSLITSGVTADSNAAGMNTASAASSSTLPAAVPRSSSPAQRTSGSVTAVVTAAAQQAPAPSRRRGSSRSASQPPVHAP